MSFGDCEKVICALITSLLNCCKLLYFLNHLLHSHSCKTTRSKTCDRVTFPHFNIQLDMFLIVLKPLMILSHPPLSSRRASLSHSCFKTKGHFNCHWTSALYVQAFDVNFVFILFPCFFAFVQFLFNLCLIIAALWSALLCFY